MEEKKIADIIREFDEENLIEHIILIGTNGKVRNIEIYNDENEEDIQ